MLPSEDYAGNERHIRYKSVTISLGTDATSAVDHTGARLIIKTACREMQRKGIRSF